MRHTIPLEVKDAPDGGEVTLDALQEAVEKHAKATGETITKLTDELAETKASLLELEQKAAESGLGVPGMGGGSDLASTLTTNELVQSMAKKANRAGGVIEVKTDDLLGPLEQKSTTTQNSEDLGPRGYSGLHAALERQTFIFDLLPKVPVTGNTVDVVRELSFTNNAGIPSTGSPAVYTEGAAKPESDIVFESISLTMPVTAHWLKASLQSLADAPQLRALLERRLRHGLMLANDSQIVTTMTTNGNHTAYSPSSGDDAIASINKMIAQAESNESSPTTILLNPQTWRSIQRLRATGGDEQFLVGNPGAITGERLWGLPVVTTNAITQGEAVVADFVSGCEYYIRQSSVIDLGFVNDDFTKNLVTIRAENRGALQVIRPVAIQYGDLVL